MDPRYVDERNALHAAVVPALEEDAKGTVSMATCKRHQRGGREIPGQVPEELRRLRGGLPGFASITSRPWPA